jgi:hypothetical protein
MAISKKIALLSLLTCTATTTPYSNYLNLMKKTLLNLIYQDGNTHGHPFNLGNRLRGRDWPASAHTMVGLDGLNNIEFCLRDVIKNNIPGDCIETGVWRGGSCIFMRAVLKEYGIKDKTIWVADSFQGMPEINPEQYPADTAPMNYPDLCISLETVKSNFSKYDLLDNQVKFLPGWFKDTLATAPIEKLCLLRLDGALYESTIDALTALYPKLSVGGYVIIDDYVAMPNCAKAVQDYRRANNISDEMAAIGWSIVYWKKTK